MRPDQPSPERPQLPGHVLVKENLLHAIRARSARQRASPAATRSRAARPRLLALLKPALPKIESARSRSICDLEAVIHLAGR